MKHNILDLVVKPHFLGYDTRPIDLNRYVSARDDSDFSPWKIPKGLSFWVDIERLQIISMKTAFIGLIIISFWNNGYISLEYKNQNDFQRSLDNLLKDEPEIIRGEE